jgi:hypothetical protein
VITHADSPDYALITDKLNSKETPANLKAFLMGDGDLQASG